MPGSRLNNSIEPDSAHETVIRVVIVMRRRLDGDALAALLQSLGNFCVLCTTTDCQVAADVGNHRHPDVVILDAELFASELQNGDGCAGGYLGRAPILLLDAEVNNGRLAAVLDHASLGYFTRSVSSVELAEGIRQLAGGKRAFGSNTRDRILQTAGGWKLRHDSADSLWSKLTPREIQVLRLVAQGLTVKDCAEELRLASSTVDNHKARLMKKLGVHKSLELTRLAIREGLIGA